MEDNLIRFVDLTKLLEQGKDVWLHHSYVISYWKSARAIKQEIICIQIRKEEIKLSSVTDNKIVDMENSRKSRKILLEQIGLLSKGTGYKVNRQIVVFLYTSNEQ